MGDRRIDRETTKKLRDAADRLLTDLLTDPHVAKAVAEPLIEDAINAGELIPRERLMVAAGFELAPFGRLADLEDAVLNAIEALELDEPDPKGALKALMAVMPTPEPEPEAEVEGEVDTGEGGEAEVASGDDSAEDEDDGPGDELVVPELEAIEEAEDVDNRPQAPMPPRRERPTEDDPGACTVCGDLLEYPVALRSWTRFRVLLCDADYTSYKPPSKEEGGGDEG